MGFKKKFVYIKGNVVDDYIKGGYRVLIFVEIGKRRKFGVERIGRKRIHTCKECISGSM